MGLLKVAKKFRAAAGARNGECSVCGHLCGHARI